MKKRIIYTISTLILAFNIMSAQVLPVVAPEQDKPLILAGGNIHTGTGEVIVGDLAFRDGKITAVGSLENLGSIDDYERIDVSGREIYPGLIFVNTTLGLVEIGGVDVTVDNSEYGQINPGARSAVAYNTDSHVIPVVRSNGILLAQVVPTGGTLSGTSSVMQLDAWNWEDAIYEADEGVHLNWPRISSSRGRRAMYARFLGGGSRSSYDDQLEELTNLFRDARAYAEIEKPEKTNQHLEAISGLFDGDQTLYIHTSEAKGIIASVNFAREQGVKRMVLVGANEQAWMVKDFIKENNIPVILSHIHSMPAYEHSDVRMPFKLAKMFSDEGIVTGITYSNQAYGYNLPFVAGQTVPYGVGKEEALAMVTLNNAKILGIEERCGSLEKGKDANIVVSNGDLLDMLGNDVVLAFINGRSIDLDNKHKMLYRRFQEKYKR